MDTYISKVDVDEAPVVPGVLANHRSYETSATRSDDAPENEYDQVAGMETIEERVLPKPT